MVSPSYGSKLSGGAENQLKILIKNLKLSSKKINIKVASSIVSKHNKLILNCSNFLYPFGFLLTLLYYIKKNNFDTIHLHTFNSPAWCVAFLGHFIKKKILIKITLSGKKSRINNISKSFFLKKIFHFFFNKKNIYFIAINSEINYHLRKLNIKKSQIIKISNGVEIPKKNDFNKSKNFNKIIFFGRLIKRKRVYELVKIFFNNRYTKKFKLDIFGNGPDYQLISNITKKTSNISLHNSLTHNQILRKISEYKVFINPSLNEGMSNAILESMARGLITIATNNKQNQDLIKNNYNGFLFNNLEEIPSILKKLNNKSLSKKISKNAKLSLLKNFDIKKICNKYLDIYSN